MEEKKLDELKTQAEGLENKSDPMIPEKPSEKKKVGRPKKNKDAAPGPGGKPEMSPEQKAKSQAAAAIPNSVIIKPLMPLVSAVGVSIAGHTSAALKPEEAEALANALGLVMDKYLPNAFDKYGPEIVLAMVLGQYGMRVYAVGKYRDELNKENPEKPPMGGPVEIVN